MAEIKDKLVTAESLKSAYDALNNKSYEKLDVTYNKTNNTLVLQNSPELPKKVYVDGTLTKSGNAADAKATGDAIAELKNENTELKSDLVELAESYKSYNLLNPNTVHSQVRPKGTAGMSPTDYEGGNYNSSDFIEFDTSVSRNVEIVLNFKDSVSYFRLYLYKNSGFYSAISLSALTNIGDDTYKYTMPIGTNNYNGFVVVTSNTFDHSNLCIVESNYWDGEFQKYGETWNYINDFRIAKNEDDAKRILGVEYLKPLFSPLYGKSIVWFGDSITDAVNVGWSVKIPQKYSMNSINYAKSGSTVSYRHRETETTQVTNCISYAVETYANQCVGKDYIILSGGINDAFGGSVYPIGSLHEGYSGEISDKETTTLGALENAVRLLLSTCLGSKVGYILTYRMPTATKQDAQFDAIKSCCEKYGIPVLDLRYDSGVCAGIDSVNTSYFLNGDKTHLTEEGYAKYCNDKVAKWIESL